MRSRRRAKGHCPDTGMLDMLGGLSEERDLAVVLWESFSPRLLRVVHAWYRHVVSAAADEEDVVLDALYSLWRHCSSGAFGERTTHARLWRTLVTIARRKFISERRHSARLRRAGTVYLTDSALERAAGGEWLRAGEEYDLELLVGSLQDQSLQAVAFLMSRGLSADEIAGHLGISERTVRRKFAAIRRRAAINRNCERDDRVTKGWLNDD